MTPLRAVPRPGWRTSSFCRISELALESQISHRPCHGRMHSPWATLRCSVSRCCFKVVGSCVSVLQAWSWAGCHSFNQGRVSPAVVGRVRLLLFSSKESRPLLSAQFQAVENCVREIQEFLSEDNFCFARRKASETVLLLVA